MENKQTLIFIKQKNRTDDVLSIKPGIDGKIKVRYTNNKEYSYNKEDVEEYQFLEKLPVENYQFSRSGYGAYKIYFEKCFVRKIYSWGASESK